MSAVGANLERWSGRNSKPKDVGVYNVSGPKDMPSLAALLRAQVKGGSGSCQRRLVLGERVF